MDSNYEDSDDSSLFIKSLGQKRKASANASHKNFKQPKLNLPQSQNSQTENEKPDITRVDTKNDDDLAEIIGKNESKSSKRLENSSESNESISSYFDERTGTNTCPLCLKRFETDSGYATHMKQCAKKRKMTTQQLLAALELQKKQMKERKALGLPSQIIAPKKSTSRKKDKQDVKSDYDLALGLALSKSLDSRESQKSTLQEFGFTYNGPGPSKKIRDLKKWVLKERTHEERQRIVTEKAAVVLLDEGEESNSGNAFANRYSYYRNESLTKFQNRVPRLWNLGEDEGNSEWYVNNMKELMRIEEEEEKVGEDNEKEKKGEKNEKMEKEEMGEENIENEKNGEEDKGKEKDKDEDKENENNGEEDKEKEKDKENENNGEEDKEKEKDKENENNGEEDKEKEKDKENENNGEEDKEKEKDKENENNGEEDKEKEKDKENENNGEEDKKKEKDENKEMEEEGEDKEKEKEKDEDKVKEEEEGEDKEKGGGDNPRRPSITQENLTREIKKLKLPKERVYLDWKKMINNDKLSDLVGRTKDSKTVYMHCLVLYTRCPDLVEKDHKSIFSNHSLSTVLIFLEYLYCGTLNGLTSGEFDNVSKLAVDLDYRELTDVLNHLENNLTGVESSEGIIPSSLTPDEDNEIAIIDVRKRRREDEEVTILAEEKDLFEEEMIDLTHGSPAPEDNEKDEVESNADKSYWSFVQERRREKLKAELKRKEEEREKSMISAEMEKIQTRMEQQNKIMQMIYDEFEEEETDIKRLLEVDSEEEEEEEEKAVEEEGERSPAPPRNRSDDSAAKDLFEDVQGKEDVAIDCIVLSSDSESRGSKGEEEDGKSDPVDVTSKPNLDYEAPFYDPYDNFNDFSNCNFSPVAQQSQSLVSEIAPFPSPLKKTPNERSDEEGVDNRSKGPEYFSTPVTKRHSRSRINSSSSEIKSGKGRKKRKSALGASLIVRKSLGLTGKKIKSSSAKKKSKKSRNSGSKQKDLAKILTDSVISELSTSLRAKTSTPVQNRFVEMTPRTTGDVDFGESVTPDPNFSNMGESMLKEHLSKYGLKKSLAKTKARKILRHIYEELHPILNTETGKLVKMIPSDNPKGRKKGKLKKAEKKTNSTKSKKQKDTETETATATATKEPENNINDGLYKHHDLMSDESTGSFERSTDYDSDRSEFEDVQEPMTQSVANNPVDLPSALNKFLNKNPEFHQKILLYEPIWLEELQRKMKEVFQKHFKLSDLMEYLDQKCITFRSEAQKKTNEKKNQKTKKSKQSKEKKELL